MVWNIPDLKQLLRESQVLSIPLRATFGGTRKREVMLLSGPQGVGEWAAFPEYSDEEAAKWLRSALEQACDSSVPLPDERHQQIPVNAIFPNLDEDFIAEWWGLFPGAKSAKVKVPEGLEWSTVVDRIRLLRQIVGPSPALRLDANGRWSVAQAYRILAELRTVGIDYVEQPVATLDEMVELKHLLDWTGIRLAADELIRKSNQLSEVINRRAADVAVLKVSPLGGISCTLAVARKAIEGGLEVVISSGLETSVGLAWAARAVALLTSEFGPQADAGLATATLLVSDVTSKPLLVEDGAITITTPKLDNRLTARLAASRDRTMWWRERLRRCLPLVVR